MVNTETKTLDNGLRVLVVPMEHSYSVGVGLFVRVGSRYEGETDSGVSHFIEHMLFKGTRRRPTAKELSMSIEGIGGIFNANTGHELTTYWAKVGRDHIEIALDVLTDMVHNSLFAEEEVEKERRVIVEEINESLDTPENLVFMVLDELLWPDHPLGRDIAGTRETVSNITRTRIVEHWSDYYHPANMVLAVAGPVGMETVIRLVEPRFGSWGENGAKDCRAAPQPQPGPRSAIRHRDIEQAHLCLACPGLPRRHPDRFALRLLNAVLGEGMSSRLFLEVREQQGLAYSVYSYASYLSDSGALVTYAGVDPDTTDQALAAILREWDRLRQEPVSEEELSKTKEFVKGRTLLRMEDSYANASWVGVQASLDDRVESVDDVLRQVDSVTPADIQRIAQSLIREELLRLAIVGPLPEDNDWIDALHF